MRQRRVVLSRIVLSVVTIVAFASMVTTAGAQEAPSVTADPDTELSDGDTLMVEATGFPAGGSSFSAGQCVTPIEDFLQQCDVLNIVPTPMNADGEASFEITVSTGPIGDGMCGEGEVQCVIAVGSLTESEFGFAPIYFGADMPPEPVELAATGPSTALALTGIAFALIAIGALLTLPRARMQLRRN